MTEPQYEPPTGAPVQFSLPESPDSKPRRKRWPWIVGGLLVVVLTLVGGCGYFAVRFYNTPTVAGTIFVTSIQEGDYATAYNGLCAESKTELTVDEFTENHVPSQDIDTAQPLVDSLSTSGDTDVFIVNYEFADGTREVVEYPMVKQDGKWKVCNPPVLE